MYLTWLQLQKRMKMGWYFANMLFDFITILAEMSLITSAGTKRKVGRPSVIEAHPEIMEIDTLLHSILHLPTIEDAMMCNTAMGWHYQPFIVPSLEKFPLWRKFLYTQYTVFFCHQIRIPNTSKCYKGLVDAKQLPKRNEPVKFTQTFTILQLKWILLDSSLKCFWMRQ